MNKGIIVALAVCLLLAMPIFAQMGDFETSCNGKTCMIQEQTDNGWLGLGIFPTKEPRIDVKELSNTNQCLANDCKTVLQITAHGKEIYQNQGSISYMVDPNGMATYQAYEITEVQKSRDRVVCNKYDIPSDLEQIPISEGEVSLKPPINETPTSPKCLDEQIVTDSWTEEVKTPIDLDKFSFKPEVTYTIEIDGQKRANIDVQHYVNVYGQPLKELSWWNSSWSYKMNYSITNTYRNLVNYPVRLYLNASSVGANWNWSNNGSDIRFLNSSEDGTFSYNIYNWSSSSQTAVVDVNVTSLPNSTTPTQIFIYYGNLGASSASDPYRVYDIYDTCEGAALNATLWTITQGSPTVSGGECRFDANDGATSVLNFVGEYEFDMNATMYEAAGTGVAIFGWGTILSFAVGGKHSEVSVSNSAPPYPFAVENRNASGYTDFSRDATFDHGYYTWGLQLANTSFKIYWNGWNNMTDYPDNFDQDNNAKNVTFFLYNPDAGINATWMLVRQRARNEPSILNGTEYLAHVAPIVNVTSPTNTTYTINSVTITFLANSSNVSSLECFNEKDGVESLIAPNVTSNTTHSEAWSGLANGGHNYSAKCSDGTANGTSLTVYFTINQTDITNLNETYNDPVYETSDQSFGLDLNVTANIIDINASLRYNGTFYQATKTLVGSEYLFNTTLHLPLINVNNTKVAFNWSYNYTNSSGVQFTGYNTSDHNQTLLQAYYISGNNTNPTSTVELGGFNAFVNITKLVNNLSAYVNTIFNGTNSSMPLTFNGASLNTYSVGLSAPLVATDTNFTLLFNASLYDANTSTSRLLTAQANESVIFINATGGYSCPAGTAAFLNFSLLDEETLIAVNGSLELTIFVITNSTPISFNFTGNTSYVICFNHPELNYTINATMQYYNATSSVKTYYLVNQLVTNNTLNVSLPLLLASLSTKTIINVQDLSNARVPGAYVYIDRWYPGTNQFMTTAMILTDNLLARGITYIHADVGFYRFVTNYLGINVSTISKAQYNVPEGGTYIPLTIVLNQTFSKDNPWNILGVSVHILPDYGYFTNYTANPSITIVYNDSLNVTTQARWNITYRLFNSSVIQNYANITTTNQSFQNITLLTIGGRVYMAELCIDRGQTYCTFKDYVYVGASNLTATTLQQLETSSPGITLFLKIAVLFMLIVAVAVVSRFAGAGAMIIMILGMVLSAFVGIFSVGEAFFIILISIIVLWRLSA